MENGENSNFAVFHSYVVGKVAREKWGKEHEEKCL